MHEADNGVLRRVGGEHVARALQQLPNPDTATHETAETFIEVPQLGRVRVTAVLKRNPRWKGHRYWSAVRADQM
jgi:hypothetical protein